MDTEVNLKDIVHIVRETRDIAVLKEYGLQGPFNNNTDLPIRCEMCGERTTANDICSDKCIEETVKHLLETNPEFVKRILTTYAIDEKLPDGMVIMYYGHGYRNENKVFWDAKNKRIVKPFTEIDDYGSVPPIFPVGNGDFNPTDWLDVIDHNTFVFPNLALIKELKTFASSHPAARTSIVKINGKKYDVKYDPEMMKNNWYTAYLEVERRDRGNTILHVYPGYIEWRPNFTTRMRNRKTSMLLSKRPKEVPLPNAVLKNIGLRYLGGRSSRTRKHRRR